jgi:hypothetical protein
MVWRRAWLLAARSLGISGTVIPDGEFSDAALISTGSERRNHVRLFGRAFGFQPMLM